MRVSDFLRQQASLLVLRHCTYGPYGEPADSAKTRTLVLIVNLSAAVGGPSGTGPNE